MTCTAGARGFVSKADASCKLVNTIPEIIGALVHLKPRSSDQIKCWE